METKALAEEGVNEQSGYRVIIYPSLKLPLQYRNLIFSKWLRSLKFGNDYFRLIDNDAYYASYNTYIDSLLKRPSALVKLAVLADDHDVVLGFSLCEGPTLHYVHVHRDQRKQGIARSLLPTPFESFTHVTKTWLSMWPKFPKTIFNPFL
jgi:hypothetical protein